MRKVKLLTGLLILVMGAKLSAGEQEATQAKDTADTAYDLALWEHDQAVERMEEEGITNPWTVAAYAVAMNHLEDAAEDKAWGLQYYNDESWGMAEIHYDLSTDHSTDAVTVFKSIYP